MKKINENVASNYLEIQYVDIRDEIHELSARKNFAGIFQAIVNHINLLISIGKIEKIGGKIKTIAWLYKLGNENVKYIIENIFVRSFDGMKYRCATEQWTDIVKLIPNNLKNIYQLQCINHLNQKIIL